MPTEDQLNDFQSRLARINSGERVVADGLYVPERPVERDVNLNGSMVKNAVYPLTIVCAFLSGLLAVFVGRYARYHFTGLSDPETDLMLAVVADGGIAMCLGFVLKQAFRLEGSEMIAAQTAGVTVMVGAMHNLVWLFPAAFVWLFSEEWVLFTLEFSQFRTIRYMGYLLPF